MANNRSWRRRIEKQGAIGRRQEYWNNEGREEILSVGRYYLWGDIICGEIISVGTYYLWGDNICGETLSVGR